MVEQTEFHIQSVTQLGGTGRHQGCVDLGASVLHSWII